jgi:hypothetical protein
MNGGFADRLNEDVAGNRAEFTQALQTRPFVAGKPSPADGPTTTIRDKQTKQKGHDMKSINRLILSAALLATVALPPALRAIEEEHPKVTNARNTVSSPANDTPKKELAAFKVAGNSMAPEGGMDLQGARKLIIGRLENDGVKGDIDPAAKISEITTKESWESAGIQLYSVRVDYAWLDGVAVVRNKESMAVLNGRVVFLADLDKDDRYEIYTNFERGSGIISLDILGYNIALKEKYSLSMRFKKDLELFVENGALMARLHPPQQNRENNAPVGKVILKMNGGKRELAIE